MGDCLCLLHYCISGSAGCIGILILNVTCAIAQWDSKRIIGFMFNYFIQKDSYPGITSKNNLKVFVRKTVAI